MALCKQAVVEQDPAKLITRVTEILELSEAKERRLGILPPKTQTSHDTTYPKLEVYCPARNGEISNPPVVFFLGSALSA